MPHLGQPSVVVFGQPVLDRFLFGVTHRISREAPVLIVREESEACYLGGAGNTACNLAGLGARAHLVGPVGDDAEAARVEGLCREAKVEASGLVRGGCPVTVTKTRILAGGLHTTRQQMLRLDREAEGGPTPEAEAKLRAAVQSTLVSMQAAIISDYGDPAQVPIWQFALQSARARNIPVVVDSRHGLLDYAGATAVTPNEPEAEALLGRTIRTREAARAAALELRQRLELEAAILTRGKLGMVVAERSGRVTEIEAIGGEAVDVTGAGDTVSATLAAALAAGIGIVDAARLANRAASVVVQKTGTAPITLAELEAVPCD